MEPGQILEFIQRTDEEAVMFQLTCLEDMNEHLAMAADVRDMIKAFPPSLFIPALCGILAKEVQLFEEVPELATRAISHLVQAHPGVVERLVRVGGVVHLCQYVVPAEPTSYAQKGVAEAAIKVLKLVSEHQPHAIVDSGVLRPMITFLATSTTFFPADVVDSVLRIVDSACGIISKEELITLVPEVVSSVLLLLTDQRFNGLVLECLGTIAVAWRIKVGNEGLFADNLDLMDHLIKHLRDGFKGTSSTPDSVVLLLIELCRSSTLASLLLEAQICEALASCLSSHFGEVLLSFLPLVELLLLVALRGYGPWVNSCGQNSLLASSAGQDGSTPSANALIEAIKAEDTDQIEALIADHADVNGHDFQGQTVLIWAAYTGSVSVLEKLIAAGADVNLLSKSQHGGGPRSALHFAAMFGWLEVAAMLLKHGARADMQASESLSPLAQAKQSIVSQVHSLPGQNYEEVIDLLEAVESGTEQAWSDKRRYRVESSSKVAVRESPSVSSESVCFLSKGRVVQQVKKSEIRQVDDDKWVKIKSGQHKGWVMDKDCIQLNLSITAEVATSSEKEEQAESANLDAHHQSKILSCLVPSLVTAAAQSGKVQACAMKLLLLVYEFGTSSHLQTLAKPELLLVPATVSLLAKMCQPENDPDIQKDAVHIIFFAMTKGWEDYSQQLLRNGLLPQVSRIASGTGILDKGHLKGRSSSSNKALDTALKKLHTQIPPAEFLAVISALLHFLQQQSSVRDDDDSSEGGSPHLIPRMFQRHGNDDQDIPSQLDSLNDFKRLRTHCEAMGFSFPFTLHMEDDEEEEEEEVDDDDDDDDELVALPDHPSNQIKHIAAPLEPDKSSRKRRHAGPDQSVFPFSLLSSSAGQDAKGKKPIQGSLSEADVAPESSAKEPHLKVGVLDPVYSQNIGIHGKLGHMCMEAIGFVFEEGDSPCFVLHDPCNLQTQLNNKRILVAASGLKSELKMATEKCCTIEKKLQSLGELLQVAKRVEEVYQSFSSDNESSAVDQHPIHQALCRICETLRQASHKESEISLKEVQHSICELRDLLLAPAGITGYETEASGLASALVSYLSCRVSSGADAKQVLSIRLERLVMFGKTFGFDQVAGNKLSVLLQDQLSQAEQFQVIMYDEIAGSGRGFQALRHPIQLKFVCGDKSDPDFKELAQPSILVEPTSTGQDIQSWLQSRVEKKWYEYDRASIHFVKLAMQGVKLGASEGILRWIGTNAGKTEWTNPAKSKMICATSSSGLCSVHDFLDSSGCELGAPGCSWVGLDLGISVVLTSYTFACSSGLPEGWLLIASSTGCENDWFTLKAKAEGESSTWKLTGEVVKYAPSRKREGKSGDPKRQSTKRSKQATKATRSRAKIVKIAVKDSKAKVHSGSAHDCKSGESPGITNHTTKDMSNRTRSQVGKLPVAPKAVHITRTTRSNPGMLVSPEAVETDTTGTELCGQEGQVSKKRRRSSRPDFCADDTVLEKSNRIEEVPTSFRFFKLVNAKARKVSVIRVSDFEMFGQICDGSIDALSFPTSRSDKPVTSSMIWEWSNGSAWSPYDSRTTARLELACQNEEGKVHLTTGYFSTRGGYFVDLRKKLQVNMRTGNHRSVRRRKASQPSTEKHKSSLLQFPRMEAASILASSHLQDLLGPSPVLRRDFSALAPVFDPVNDPHHTASNPTQTLPVHVHAGDAEDEETPASAITSTRPLYLYLPGAERSNQLESNAIELGDKKTILQAVQDKLVKKSSFDSKMKRRDRGQFADGVKQLWKERHTVYYSWTRPTPAQVGPEGEQTELCRSKCEAVCTSSPPSVNATEDVQNVLFLLHLLWGSGAMSSEQLACDCLTDKLKTQMEDVLSLCCGTLPPWCTTLVKYNPMFFRKAARFDLFASKSHGFSRTVSQLDRQTQLDRQSHSLPFRQQRVGHLVTERVIVPRDEQDFFNAAEQGMKLHARRRTVLDFAFEGEEGTGVGPTAEFYTLASLGFRSAKCASMWRDVNSETGLFPALLPLNEKDTPAILRKWQFFGRFLARALLDNRLVDMHLSTSFCQLLCGQQLTLDDINNADPGLKLLMDLHADEIEAICQTMSWGGWDLVPGGCDIDVTSSNVDEFKLKAASFVLSGGIKDQMVAFRTGFEEACPLESLHALTAQELGVQLTGDGSLEWTLEHLRSTIEPKRGYTIESPPFMMFLDVLVEMDAEERKNFVWWATGSPRLPPGGLANLLPQKLSVGLKTEGDRLSDDIMLSVNVCNKIIKLPAYTTKEILRQRLCAAVNTKEAREFHLN